MTWNQVINYAGRFLLALNVVTAFYPALHSRHGSGLAGAIVSPSTVERCHLESAPLHVASRFRLTLRHNTAPLQCIRQDSAAVNLGINGPPPWPSCQNALAVCAPTMADSLRPNCRSVTRRHTRCANRKERRQDATRPPSTQRSPAIAVVCCSARARMLAEEWPHPATTTAASRSHERTVSKPFTTDERTPG